MVDKIKIFTEIQPSTVELETIGPTMQYIII